MNSAGCSYGSPMKTLAVLHICTEHSCHYPARTALATRDPATGERVTFTLEPLAADQELTGAIGGIPYWEGACRVLDAQGREVGRAFVELTGYAGSMQGRL